MSGFVDMNADLATLPRVGCNGSGQTNVVTKDQEYNPPIRGFMVETDGSVNVEHPDGSLSTYPGCVAGVMYSGVILKVLASTTPVVRGWL